MLAAVSLTTSLASTTTTALTVQIPPDEFIPSNHSHQHPHLTLLDRKVKSYFSIFTVASIAVLILMGCRTSGSKDGMIIFKRYSDIQKRGFEHCGERVQIYGRLTFVKGTYFLNIGGDVQLEFTKIALGNEAKTYLWSKVAIIGVLKCPNRMITGADRGNVLQMHTGGFLFSVEVDELLPM